MFNHAISRISGNIGAHSIVTLLLLLAVSQVSFSQTSDRQSREARTGSFINIDGLLGGDPFYFIDSMSLEIGSSQGAQEVYVNENEYFLGTGDIFSVDFSGSMNGTMRGIRVNPQGDITLPNIGSVRVKDITIAEARERISDKVAERYRDTEVGISLDRARPITIHLTGDIPYPGKREVHALTHVDQAIYTAFFEPERSTDPIAPQPGANLYHYNKDFLDRGDYSLRNITIRNSNGEVQHADLIAYFKGGVKATNPVVNDGDIITIHRMRNYSPTITISGAVKSAERLEYRSEDTLGDILTISNGYTHDANTREINIFRLEGGNINKITVDVEQEDINSVNLEPNDRIVVPFDRNLRNSRTAWVYGEAAMPGNYPIIDGQTTVYDLLQMANGISDQGLSHAAYLVRSNASSSDISGSPQFDSSLLTRTSDQLAQGFEYIDLEVGLNRNQIYLDLSDQDQLSNIQVFDGDQLHIPRDDKTIYLMGQVRSPGFYPFDASQSVDDYIARAGNFALAAEEDRIFVIKSGTRSWYRPSETNLESGDIIFVDRVPYDELQANRSYDMAVRGQRNSNIQLIMTGLATVTSIITTYVAITR